MKKFVLFIMLALLCACNKEDDHICKIACPVTDVVVSTSDEDDPIRPGTTITIRVTALSPKVKYGYTRQM